MNGKNLGSRLVRFLLEEYDYEIIYKQGKLNQNADALSRIKRDENTTNIKVTRRTSEENQFYLII